MTHIDPVYMVSAHQLGGRFYIRHRHNLRKMWSGGAWVDHVAGVPKSFGNGFYFSSREEVEEYIRYAAKVTKSHP